jgi:transketolase
LTAVDDRVQTLSIDTIRCLAMDAVQKANSGHPGTAMALAPLGYLLYAEVMKHAPEQPDWPDRDRFVLSAGHACILQYAALHLTGYDLTMDDLKAFRQWGSKTPGHPEWRHTPGVNVTTGPLGQGVGNAVGMAIAEEMLAARFNRPGHEVVNHRTFVICSDGDMMEGVSGEASSFAGFLGLGKLCMVYDDNKITIEGSTDLTFEEDVAARYEAYGWHVQRIDDGWTSDTLRDALAAADAETERPSFISLRTHIAWGAPHAQDTAKAHGAPLGEEEIRLTKQVYGWDPDTTFYVPDGVYEAMDQRARGAEAHRDWHERLAAYREAHPELAAEFDRVLHGRLPEGWESGLPDLSGVGSQATRESSGATINAIAKAVPEFVGGSADLAGSTNTLIDGADSIAHHAFAGRNFHFGIREHGMGTVLNGMKAHGGFQVFGATFLQFSDYMRPAVRLAALQKFPVTYVWTHDSIGLGEDGPTHQPIEHYAALRAIPNLRFVRPGDPVETVEAWRFALLRDDGPTGLALTRQKIPVIDRSTYAAASGLHRGAYVLTKDEGGEPDVILIGTGSELQLALDARDQLADMGKRVRVVSAPCIELFLEQDASYRDSVLPPAVWRRVSVEAGVALGWSRLVGDRGRSISIEHYGASAPAPIIYEKFGITSEAVAAAARELLQAD